MKIMFMGTPDFAVCSLKSLVKAGHDISCVVTTPDKPRGRGHNITQTPVGEYATRNNMYLVKPLNLKKENFEDILTHINPEIIIVVAYGMLLPEYVLDFPKFGCVNVHASLLPEYRGAAPIQRSIIDGKEYTGVTTMYMNKGLDTGDMLHKEIVNISTDDNFETLHDKLALIGSELIVKTVSALENGDLIPEKQNDDLSTYAHMITKDTMLIDWSKSAKNIHNLVRGLYPVPKAYTLYNGKRFKICITECVNNTEVDVNGKSCGTVVKTENDCFYVLCGENSLLKIKSVQAEGKKQMSVRDYFAGNKICIDDVLGV